ncbi:HEAT repeat domain-containing protein [Kamptonema formosum]|uniref:HEAT repeat domain-containing protein n=1 Tax=Kamptonema formosum TaxID=331992 RepID=UPI00036F85EC|nr:HEAT repeat domain-containing protein [Oscillatoria sp. PCC 10802]
MTLTADKNLSDYSSRTVVIEVTGVRRQNVMRKSKYAVRVPYSRLSQAIQHIHRTGGKIVSINVISIAVTKPSQATADAYPQLKHQNPKLRERAMRQIAEERTAQTIPQLMAILSNEDVVYRRAAVQTLGVIGLDAVPVLAQQLVGNESATVRASCAKALAAIALNFSEESFPEAGLQALQKALRDPDPVVKLATVGALSTVGAPAADILLEALHIDDIALQVAAVSALGSISDPKAAEALSSLAQNQDADPYIRESAQSALSRLEQVTQMNAAAAAKRGRG